MATPLQPVAYELVIRSEGDPTIDELVRVHLNSGSDKDWLASVGGGPYVTVAGDTPEEAVRELARTLRVIADRIDPLPAGDVSRMMLGLVRGCEFLERDHSGNVYDDLTRMALEHARKLGWGGNRTGTLGV